MPRRYLRMRDTFKKQGLSDKAAKAKAAKIYNATRVGPPVTRKKHTRKK